MAVRDLCLSSSLRNLATYFTRSAVIQMTDNSNVQWHTRAWHAQEYVMGSKTAYDRETVTLLRKVLDELWEHLPPHQREGMSKSYLAACILRHAARGERHPDRLRSLAIAEAVHHGTVAQVMKAG
jgi:hypothetical protein